MNPYRERLDSLTVPPMCVGGYPISWSEMHRIGATVAREEAQRIRHRVIRRLAEESETELRAAHGDR